MKIKGIHGVKLTEKWNKENKNIYIYIITHENISSWDKLEAGLMGLLLEAVHRCSIGAGAGTFSFSMSFLRSSMYWRSFMFGLPKVPTGKQVSETHCWPPQSKPRISSLHPTLYPSDFLQNSTSARLTFMTWSLFRGSRASSLSLNSVNESSFISCSTFSWDGAVISFALHTSKSCYADRKNESKC